MSHLKQFVNCYIPCKLRDGFKCITSFENHTTQGNAAPKCLSIQYSTSNMSLPSQLSHSWWFFTSEKTLITSSFFSLTFANLNIEICPIFIMNYFRFIYIYLDINLGFSGSSASKESTCNAGSHSLIPGSGRSTGEGIGYPFQYCWVSLVAQTVKIRLQCGRPGSIPGLRRSPEGGHGNPLQYSCLEKPVDRGAWLAIVHRAAKSQTQLSD